MSNYVLRNMRINNDRYRNRCFICLENTGTIINPCICTHTGTNNGVHRKCLEKWIKTSKKDYCTICNYKYKYEFLLDPSYNRFKRKYLDCDNDYDLAEQQEDDYDIAEQQEDDYDNNITLFFSMIFFLPLNLIFCITLHKDPIMLLSIFWSFSLFSFLFFFILKSLQLDINFNVYLLFRNSQLLLYLFTFVILNIIYNQNYSDCKVECKKICETNCTYYPKYKKKMTEHVQLISNRLIMSTLIIFIDIIYKLKDYLFTIQIAKYGKIYLNKIYPHNI